MTATARITRTVMSNIGVSNIGVGNKGNSAFSAEVSKSLW